MAQQSQHWEDEVAYYYDLHPTKEDLMGETAVHAALVHYLMEVLSWQFRGQLCAIHENLNFYQTRDVMEYPLAPDIAVIKGMDYDRWLRSWSVGKLGAVPQVVFEIASKETWNNDLVDKPLAYAHMGVKEYYAYDPNVPPLRRARGRRLFGWHLERERGEMRELALSEDGRLWSPHLESWLVPDRDYLRLYDNQGQRRLTQAEAEAEARQAAERQAELEALRAEEATRQAELEAQRAEEAIRKASALAEKLRSLGIDPDQL
jgi:Uma2 family endonuclease